MFLNPQQALRLAAVASVASVLVVLSACGGGSSSDPQQPANQGALKPVSQPGEFVEQVKALLARRQSVGVADGVPAIAMATAASTAPPSFSTTTRQEEGVDEDDLIKTDGVHLYAVVPSNAATGTGVGLQALRRAADGSLTELQRLTLSKADDYEVLQGMHLAPSAQRIAALRRSYSFRGIPCPGDAVCVASFVMPMGVTTTLDLLKVNGGGTLEQPTTVQLQGDLVATRLIGSTMVLVTTHQPLLAAEGASSAADRAAALAALTESQVMPTVRVNGGAAQPLVRGTDCYVQPGNGSTSMSITTVTLVNLGRDGFEQTSRCFLGGTEAIYMSPKNLYLATSRWTPPTRDASGRWIYPAQAVNTDIHKFALGSAGASYRATGQVEGHLGWARDSTSYRLSEHADDLRVVTFTGSTGWGVLADAASLPASPATLTVLREQSATGTLDVVGKLPNARRPAAIGLPGEQVYGVRLVGDRGYVVTFRQVDPLYVLDLSDPSDPKQLGELKVRGFSSDLYPLPGGLLLGVGRDATEQGFLLGAKVALFDVSDPTQPRELDVRTFGTSGSSTALESTPHGISLFTQGTTVRVAIPMVTTSSPFDYATAQRALQRLQVDTQARTLSVRPAVSAVSASGGPFNLWDVSTHRSVHIADHVYYYNDGTVTPAAW